MMFYHFTSPWHLRRIQRDGFLRPTESNFSFLVPRAGPDVVWLLDTDDPRLTVGDSGKLLQHGLTAAKRRVCIAVRVPAIRWLDWAPAVTGMDEGIREALIETGGGIEAAQHWYVWPARIPRSRWVSVDIRPGAAAA